MIELLLTFLRHAITSPPQKSRFIFLKWVGALLMISGSILGAYFLFKRLGPILGEIEAGLVMSGILIVIGFASVFFFHQKNTQSPLHTWGDNLKEMAKDYPIEEFVKKNKKSIPILALIGGILFYFLIFGSKKSRF